MANTYIPLRMQYTGSSVTAVAEYQAGDTMQMPGNVQLVGTARRFLGDFSASAVNNRSMLQSSVTNGNTSVGVVPNGTSTIANLTLYNNSADQANSALARFGITSGEVSLEAGVNGTGSYLPLTLYAGGALRMQFDTSGGLYFGASNNDPVANQVNGMYRGPAGSLAMYANSGTVTLRLGAAAGSQSFVSFTSNGSTAVGSISTTGSATAYNTSSDYRLKDDVADLDATAAEARVLSYRPVTWTWKSTGGTGKGFIAHEAQAVDPDVATGVKDQVKRVGDVHLIGGVVLAKDVDEGADLSAYGEYAMWTFTHEVPVYQGMDVSFMVPDVIAMLQKMRAELDATKIELSDVKAALAALTGA